MKASLTLKATIFALMLSAMSACEQSSLPSLKIAQGQRVPDLKVKDLTGNETTLSLASGQVLILNVWATWCGPCRHEMPSLDRLSRSLDSTHYSVVGLSVDTDDHVVREFLIERKVSFPNYMDPAMEVANQVFGIRAFPSTFVFGPDGRLLEVIEGWREWDTPSMVGRITNLANSASKEGGLAENR
ncbi:TlpA family protein disulfide reductase [Kaarinaea lacus]